LVTVALVESQLMKKASRVKTARFLRLFLRVVDLALPLFLKTEVTAALVVEARETLWERVTEEKEPQMKVLTVATVTLAALRVDWVVVEVALDKLAQTLQSQLRATAETASSQI
jgi:hypothetical protein